MERLTKSYNGQWTLVKSDGLPEKGKPWTEVHFSDNSKKGFPYRHQAVSHLLVNDYFPKGERSGNIQHFEHQKDHSKTAKVVFHQAYGKDSKEQTRRASDTK